MTKVNLASSLLAAELFTKQVALGNVSGVVACDLSQGFIFVGTQTGDITGFTFTNWPAAGVICEPELYITSDTNTHAITLSSGALITWLPSGTQPSFASGSGVINVIDLESKDQGTTIIGRSDFTESEADARYIQPGTDVTLNGEVLTINNGLNPVSRRTVAAQTLDVSTTITLLSTDDDVIFTVTLSPTSGSTCDIELASTLPGMRLLFLCTQDTTGNRLLTVNGVSVPLGQADLVPSAAFRVQVDVDNAGNIWPGRI
jgi:hypothetical protein